MLPERQNSNRRDWISRVLETIAFSALAAPLCAEEHLHPGPPNPAGQITEPWQPAFLTKEQNETLISLGECMVPGSAAAKCNRVIDLILTLESEKNKRETIDSLSAFESEAKALYRNSFHALQPAQRNDLLLKASSGNGALSAPFNVIKEWVADAYWSSQEGMRELGWKGRVAWSSFEGCAHGPTHS